MWPFKRKLGDNDLANPTAVVKFMNSFTHTLRSQFGRTGSLFGKSPNGLRDYFMLFGYAESLSFADYYSMYMRGGIARAVVDKVAKSCWRDVPTLEVNEKPILEDEVTTLKKIGLFSAMERADTLNRIGNFSVLLVGVQDGLDLDQPLGSAVNLEQVYFNPYSYDGIEINKWDTDPVSPRYGKPVQYSLTTRPVGDEGKQVQVTARVVHWTRVVHMAEGALGNSLEGSSSLQPIWNTLIDLLKTRGGSAEALFRNGRQKFSLEADKDTKLDTTPAGLQTLKDDVEAFTNNQQDFMRMQGISAKVFQPSVASPRDNFDIEIEEIAGVTGIPIRVLTGVGGGQLAGSEDRASWNGLVDDRQNLTCSGYLEQALTILDDSGLIDLPDSFEIVWPVSPVLNELEAAKVTSLKAIALRNAVIAFNDPMGSEIDKETALKELGLEGVEIDETDIPFDEDEEDETA